MVNIEAKRVEFENALMNKDAERVANIFTIPEMFFSNGKTNFLEKHNQSLFVDEIDYGVILGSLLDTISFAKAGDAEATFEAQACLHSTFNRIFRSSEGNWLIPAMIVICKNTNRISTQAYEKNSNQAKFDQATTNVRDSFSFTINDRVEYHSGSPFDTHGSKKSGVLAIVNELFSMYFRINNLKGCKNIIALVKSKGLQEKGTLAAMTTYRYYIGRLNLYEDNLESAETHLDYAFQHCHKNSVNNKRRILKYLVPIKVYRGRLPTTLLLEKYGLEEFKPIVKGIRKGDLRTFQDGLIQFQDNFIRQGTYLLLEKCKTVCYRNLLKRVHKIIGNHQMPLNDITNAYKWLGMPIDLDEIECILANLIYQGYIRGYLSHGKRILVVSKRDPFPTSVVIK